MKISVIGSGVMGKAIVSYLSLCPSIKMIYWKGSSEGRTSKEMSALSKVLKRVNRKKNCNYFEAVSKIIPINFYEELSDSSVAIEAVSEAIDIKRAVFSELTSYVDDRTIIATNTSSISITELANFAKNPSRFIGIHFFNPIEMLELVEIVSGYYTSDDTLAWSYKFICDIEKKPIKLNETPGFIVNRMIIPMINEAIVLLSEGIATKEDIDNAMKLGANHPIGPLSLSDLIGNDIVLSIMQTLFNETNDPKYRPHPMLRKLVRAGAMGRKSKKGFYNYSSC